MNLADFEQGEINGHNCYEAGLFLVVQNSNGKWNAYNNGSAIEKFVMRKDKDDKGADVDVLGATEYPTPQAAAAVCIEAV